MLYRSEGKKIMSLKRVIAITGCDSGLGWAMAARAAREGLVTVAGMYSGVDTKAAEELKEFQVLPVHLDVTKWESVQSFAEYVRQLLSENPDFRLYAVVNNAGVMTVGDFEWQTADMLESTVDVNLLGTIRTVSTFLPDLRTTALEGKVRPRIINVASHCGLQPLPGFSAYSATKAGVLALTEGIRKEQRDYGLSAVSFIPGGFIGSSNILSTQDQKYEVMLQNLNDEQRSFYGKRIINLAEYLRPVSLARKSASTIDTEITETFMKAVNDYKPKTIYKVENWRYKFYYFLMKLPLPDVIHCWIVKRYIRFPEN